MTTEARDPVDLRARLTRPLGRYDVARAAQLSGIPERTIHHWAEEQVLMPDYGPSRPMFWSYRDLVFLRLAAWLRSKDMELKFVGPRIEAVRVWLEDPNADIRYFRSQGRSMTVDDEALDRVSGELLIPAVVEFISTFDLLSTLHRTDRSRYWGPDLIRPTTRVRIVPWVMGGEPCIEKTRVATSTLYALHAERGLSEIKIAALYPGVPAEAVLDAIDLETKLRRLEPAA